MPSGPTPGKAGAANSSNSGSSLPGPVLVVLTPIPDDAPAPVREGIARRNLVLTEGACPCGATVIRPNRAERRKARGDAVHVAVRHEDDCPAIHPATVAWLRGGER